MATLHAISALDIVFCLALALAIPFFSLAAYRAWLSPLSRFPGPTLAKASFWYEFYYDWFKPGMYHQKIQEMHRRYGPVVQITPDEIHISDAAYFNKVFVTAGTRKTDMYVGPFRGTPFEDYIEILRKHETHRLLRMPIQNSFSRGSVRSNEPHVVETVRMLASRLAEYKDTGRPVDMSNVLLSFAVDSVSASMCERPTRYLEDPEFNAVWFKSQKHGMTWLPLLAMLPRTMRRFIMRLLNFISSVTPSTKAYIPRKNTAYRAGFREALQPSPVVKFGSTERTVGLKKRFGDDIYDLGGQLLQQAGVNPMSSCLQTILTHLALNPAMRQKLRSELQSLLPGSPTTTTSGVSWQQLEQLTYLDACIKEGLRLGGGNMHRTARVFPETDLVVEGWTIPRGTAVAMTPYFMHMDEEAFPRPEKFDPERWLQGDGDGNGGANAKRMMADYLVPFGKGSRDCLGRYQAQMTMCYLLNELYKPGAPELDLYETDETDVALVHGYMFPLPKLDSRGVRVLVRS
ncbi:cytochrome P450 [Aspergillus stella-maris]|uniref:cytochrome P450 n=1 Tax=Aspergillus stella-maris TaxID=1810926 RepID=UPI003CCD6DDD